MLSSARFLMADMCPHFSGGRSPGSDSEAAAEQQGQRRGKCSLDRLLQYLHITGLVWVYHLLFLLPGGSLQIHLPKQIPQVSSGEC